MTALGSASLWIAAIGCGLMAGVYFTFSAFVMSSLEVLPDQQGIAAMQSINRVILRSPFMVLFFGTTLLSLAAVGYGLWRWGSPGSTLLIAAGLIYVVGMFVATAAFNVPLNDALDAVDPATSQAAEVWGDYLSRWTRWNHLRTISSTASCALFVAALKVLA
jgi:uncharacterized membrane protein